MFKINKLCQPNGDAFDDGRMRKRCDRKLLKLDFIDIPLLSTHRLHISIWDLFVNVFRKILFIVIVISLSSFFVLKRAHNTLWILKFIEWRAK